MSCLALDDPPTEMGDAPRFISSLDLVALPSAVTVVRLFVGSTLRRWRARFIEPDAELLAAELVTYSVDASGTADNWLQLDRLDYLVVRLVGYERSIVIEVWDCHTDLPQPDPRTEPAGLELVDARAKSWGSNAAPRGRVIWAELDVHEHTASGLPVRTRRPSPYPRPPAGTLEETVYDLDTLQRVRDGIEGL